MEKILTLRWQRADSYRIVTRKGDSFLSELAHPVSYVVPEGPVREYEVNERSGPQRRRCASLMLANMVFGGRDSAAEAAKDWADQWGLLTSTEEAPVDDFYDAAMKLEIQAFAAQIDSRDFALPVKHTGRLTSQGPFDQTAENLFSYCWFELVDILTLMHARGARFKHCAYCGGLYLPKGRSPKKGRSRSRYCNHNADHCKNGFRRAGNVVPKGRSGEAVSWHKCA
jgi:hypothetical protein